MSWTFREPFQNTRNVGTDLALESEMEGFRMGAELLEGVRRCEGGGLIHLEGDSDKLVRFLKGDQLAIHWNLANKGADIRLLLSSFNQVKVAHIRRNANMAAHNLARFALHAKLNQAYYPPVPPFLTDVIAGMLPITVPNF